MALSIYNQFDYGEALYYGSVDDTSEILWALEIDWLSDGKYLDGYNEARHMIDLVVERGRDHYMNANGFERYKPGQAIAVLDNDDGRYDPWNMSGPLYTHIGPGKLAKLSVSYNSSTLIPVMAGTVIDIQPYSEGRRRLVRVVIQDGLQYLSERLTSQYVINSFGLTAIADLVDRTEWPWEDSSLPYVGVAQLYGDAAGQTFRMFLWQHKAYEAVSDIIEAFRGEVFQDASGVFTIVGPTYNNDTLTTIDESQVLVDIEIPQPWEILWNEAAIAERYYINGANTDLWDLGNPIPIAAGQTVNINAMFNYQNFRPVGGQSFGALSFAVNTQSDGGGTNITSSCTGTFETLAGEGTLITITNYSASDGYIIACTVNGSPVYSPNDSIYTSKDTSSQAQWGKRTFKLDNIWVQGGDYAQGYADLVTQRFASPTYLPKITIEKRPDLQFGKELYIDGIRFTSATLGIDQVFRIGSIRHEWVNSTGQHVRTKYSLEPLFTEGDPVYELKSTFENITEIDNTLPPASGFMEWDYDGFNTGWNYSVAGYTGQALRLDLNDVNIPGDFPTVGLSLPILDGAIVQFRYRWEGTGALSIQNYCLFILITDVATRISDGSFFVQSADTGWLLHETDLSAWAGETVTNLIFRHNITAAGGTLKIDEVRLGKRLDFSG